MREYESVISQLSRDSQEPQKKSDDVKAIRTGR